MNMEETIAQYKEDFDLFPTANEKLEYIFDLGKKHTTLPDEEKNDDTFVVWLCICCMVVGECKDGILLLTWRRYIRDGKRHAYATSFISLQTVPQMKYSLLTRQNYMTWV